MLALHRRARGRPDGLWQARNIKALPYVPDIEPGLALKTLSRLADCIAVTADESPPFPPRVRVVTPVIPPDPTGSWDRAAARQNLGLTDDHLQPCCSISGGSKGAAFINQALFGPLRRSPARPGPDDPPHR